MDGFECQHMVTMGVEMGGQGTAPDVLNFLRYCPRIFAVFEYKFDKNIKEISENRLILTTFSKTFTDSRTFSAFLRWPPFLIVNTFKLQKNWIFFRIYQGCRKNQKFPWFLMKIWFDSPEFQKIKFCLRPYHGV